MISKCFQKIVDERRLSRQTEGLEVLAQRFVDGNTRPIERPILQFLNVLVDTRMYVLYLYFSYL